MDASTINARIYAGRGKVGKIIGSDCAVFRPLAIDAPLANQVATVKASFNAADNSYAGPNLPGKAIWFGDFDGSQTRPGDYLVRAGDGQTFYIAGQQPLLPIVCIECNRRISISRQAQQTQVGAVDYGGLQAANAAPVMGGPGQDAFWPASVLLAGSGQGSGVKLPGSVAVGSWRIMLPALEGVILLAGDEVLDELGTRYNIVAAELTDLGWRINATEVHA